MSGYIKNYNDVAFRHALTGNSIFINGDWITGSTPYKLGAIVKKFQFTPADRKSKTEDILYMQGELNYYEAFETYSSVTAWTDEFKATIQCKIEYGNDVKGIHDNIVNEFQGKTVYWHLAAPYLDEEEEECIDYNTTWYKGRVKVDKITSGDDWTFNIIIEGDMTTYTENGTEVTYEAITPWTPGELEVEGDE